MSEQIVKEILEDADALRYIVAGADHAQYDLSASRIFAKLSNDLSVAQIEKIIWNEFYYDFCVGTIGNTNDYFAIDKTQARYILGEPSRFNGIAKNIRWELYKL